MTSEREPRYRGPYDDGTSPVAMGLAVLVLVIIVAVAGWLLIPCQYTGRCNGPVDDLDRYQLQSAVRSACNAASTNGIDTRAAIELDCWCVAGRLVPGMPSDTRPGLSAEGLRTLERALTGTAQPVSFAELGEMLGFADHSLFARLISAESDCAIETRLPRDRYPEQPWLVRDGCVEPRHDGGFDDEAYDGGALPPSGRRGSYVTIEFGTHRRSDLRCLPRETASRLYADGARYWLLRGDAELSRHDVQCLAETGQGTSGEITACASGWRGGLAWVDGRYQQTAFDTAMRYWHQASDWGRPFGAQASIMAQRRLQAHMVQCMSASDGSSLRRLAEGGPGGQGEAVLLSLRQRALAALGYYAGPIDGLYTADTREATRGFQRELGYDETGTLTPRQTTLLICHAAQTARDAQVQNALGIMYALGLGVEDNIDLALEWLETAARRNDRDAYLNLALIYGTGRVLDSYRLCAVTENAEQADSYLREAARLNHPRAAQWCRTLGCGPGTLSPSERWQRIKEILEEEGWPDDGHLDPPDRPLPDSCLHAEARHAGGPP
ncbi:peptidoglycan-binding protein [Glycocaulis sp.]|uniref:peptidoglycan-binding protein n=1 Tax=Glycocaulis sp. TaxID=1969725 RepID=UPI0025C5D648|nr:peptidoglycan-binding protein [Glycocaulis sp.]MCH8522868.1 peptidoglycan-binding protein [Glycocaulis sp.]